MSEREEDGQAIEHPIRKGAMLRRRHEAENTAVLMEVVGRYRDIDDRSIEYELSCPTHTGYHRYHAEDLEDCFEDTGLTNEGSWKPIGDPEIRELYQQLHDEHGEHSFTTVHDSDGEISGEQCLHCKKLLPYPEDDACPDCGTGEHVGLNPDDETGEAELVCTRHGVIREVVADA